MLKRSRTGGPFLALVDVRQHDDADQGYEEQRQILVLEQSEGAARIVDVGEPEKARRRPRIMPLQGLPDDELGELVQRQRQRRELEEGPVPVNRRAAFPRPGAWD